MGSRKSCSNSTKSIGLNERLVATATSKKQNSPTTVLRSGSAKKRAKTRTKNKHLIGSSKLESAALFARWTRRLMAMRAAQSDNTQPSDSSTGVKLANTTRESCGAHAARKRNSNAQPFGCQMCGWHGTRRRRRSSCASSSSSSSSLVVVVSSSSTIARTLQHHDKSTAAQEPTTHDKLNTDKSTPRLSPYKHIVRCLFAKQQVAAGDHAAHETSDAAAAGSGSLLGNLFASPRRNKRTILKACHLCDDDEKKKVKVKEEEEEEEELTKSVATKIVADAHSSSEQVECGDAIYKELCSEDDDKRVDGEEIRRTRGRKAAANDESNQKSTIPTMTSDNTVEVAAASSSSRESSSYANDEKMMSECLNGARDQQQQQQQQDEQQQKNDKKTRRHLISLQTTANASAQQLEHTCAPPTTSLDASTSSLVAAASHDESTSPCNAFLPLIQALGSSSTTSFASSHSASTQQQQQPLESDEWRAFPERGVSSIGAPAIKELNNEPNVGGGDQSETSSSLKRRRAVNASNKTDACRRPASQPTAQQTTTLNIKSNFKKFVKRQQSVDSYRMARDLRQKMRRQQEGDKSKHQSSETIKTRSVGDDERAPPTSGRKFSMRQFNANENDAAFSSQQQVQLATVQPFKAAVEHVEICVDPYARPGSFTLPGEQQQQQQVVCEENDSSTCSSSTSGDKLRSRRAAGGPPKPPNTLSLLPTNTAGSSSSLLMGSAFSGCITPTYPTHHLPSPKYVSPAMLLAMEKKKYSNASTNSSSLGACLGAVDSLTLHLGGSVGGSTNNNQKAVSDTSQATQDTPSSAHPKQLNMNAHHHSDSESSFSISTGGGTELMSATNNGRNNSRQQLVGGCVATTTTTTTIENDQQQQQLNEYQQRLLATNSATNEVASSLAREEAARRANLAEHIYDNKCGLGEDMKFLASLPELCDITFLVGETREPVCAVKSVLAARSRVFNKILFGGRTGGRTNAGSVQPQQHGHTQAMLPFESETSAKQQQQQQQDRRSSSPRPLAATLASLAKSSLPTSRSTSPNQKTQQQQQQQWCVKSDTSGFSGATSTARSDLTVAGASQQLATAATNCTTMSGSRTGRVSVASTSGRNSASQASQSSQQPLIIGPGQTATLAPKQKRKNRRNETQLGSGSGGGGADTSNSAGAASRLSRMFMNKRASDPSIKHSNQINNNNLAPSTGAQLGALNATTKSVSEGASSGGGGSSPASAANAHSNQTYLDKMSYSQKSTTMIIEEFEPDVFRQLIEYIHTGCVLLQARTLLGLLNAADYYGLEQLRKACLRFVSCCITVDTVCSLLATAEVYIHFKATRLIVQKVLEFVDTHANEIFKLNAFGLLPEHVVRLILARDGLKADEHVKYNGVYTWCEHYCRSYELASMSDVMRNFLDLIQFHKIPTNVLLTEIYPTHVVPDDLFLSALAYQAEPEVFEPEKLRPRRMTLPSTIAFKENSSNDDDNEHIQQVDGNENEDKQNKLDDNTSRSARRALDRRQSNSSMASQQKKALSARKSTGGNMIESSQVEQPPTTKGGNSSTGRRGSIAPVSISSVMRLSHKLSIRKRQHSNTTQMTASELRRRGSGSSRQIGKRTSLAQSIATAGSSTSGAATTSRDPLQVGKQILDAYLEAQRQREREDEQKRRREEEASRAAEDAKRRAAGLPPLAHTSTPGQDVTKCNQELKDAHVHGGAGKRPLVKTASSSRKSFRDFKNISIRLFMRNSSSTSKNTLQQQQSTGSGRLPSIDSSLGGRESRASVEKVASLGGGGGPSAFGAGQQERSGRRRLLKIKRSDTVFEAAPASCSQSQSRPMVEFNNSKKRD